MTSQPKRRLPPRLRGNRRKLAGSEMKRGPAEKLVTGNFSFKLFFFLLCQLLFVKRKRIKAFAGIRCPRAKSCKWRKASPGIRCLRAKSWRWRKGAARSQRQKSRIRKNKKQKKKFCNKILAKKKVSLFLI